MIQTISELEKEKEDPGYFLTELIQSLTKEKDFQRILSLQTGPAYLPKRLWQLYYPKRLEVVYINPTMEVREDLEDLALEDQSEIHVHIRPYLKSQIRFFPDLILGRLPFGKLSELEENLELFNGKSIEIHALEPEIINKALKEIKNEGLIALIVSPYFLYQLKDREFRKVLVEDGLVQKVIGLPFGLFPGANIDPVLLLLGKDHKDQKIELIDYSDFFKNEKARPDLKQPMFLEAFKRDLEQGTIKSVSIDASQAKENDYQLYPKYYFHKNSLKEFDETRKISEVADVFRGKNLNARVKGTGCFVASGKDLAEQRLQLDSLKAIQDQPARFEPIYLKEGDILIFSKGVAPHIALVEKTDGKKVIPSNNFLVIRPKPGILNPSYLMAYLSSIDGKNRLDSISKGSQIKNITTPDLLNMEIPWMSLERQERLALKYEKVQEEIQEASKHLNQLHQTRTDLFDLESLEQ